MINKSTSYGAKRFGLQGRVDEYGRITIKLEGSPYSFAAHRLAYEHDFGAIPKGHVIRHLCHNPRCVNTGHLSTGTPAQNSRDMVNAGRSLNQVGENNHNSKLSNEDRAKIKRLRESGLSLKNIALKFGVSPSNISYICRA